MTRREKVFTILGLIIIIFSIALKCLLGINDTDSLVGLTFIVLMVYVVLIVCSFFPADWRMTDSQKAKIIDKEAYQANYRKIIIGITFAFSILSGCLILFYT